MDPERKDENKGPGAPRGGSPRRSGYGDDQGTRVGSPDRSGRGTKGPSSRTTSEGLEGAIMEEDDQEDQRSTGAGAEAARGAHAFGSGQTGRGGAERKPEEENLPDQETPGSEPLRGTQQQHVSGYGGSGARPKESSDKREPQKYEGSGDSEEG